LSLQKWLQQSLWLLETWIALHTYVVPQPVFISLLRLPRTMFVLLQFSFHFTV